jgi:membrane fusion protein (multidrug efflux system)
MALKGDSIMNVRLLMANNQLFQYPGRVETIEADFNNETGNIAFRATFPNPKALLRHGETGNVQMVVPYKDALIIPQKATFEVLEKKYVFVVDAQNVIHQREIDIAGEMPDLYVLRGGISPDDKIMLEGIRKVRDNEKIEKFTYEDPKKVLSHLNVYVE